MAMDWQNPSCFAVNLSRLGVGAVVNGRLSFPLILPKQYEQGYTSAPTGIAVVFPLDGGPTLAPYPAHTGCMAVYRLA